MKKGIMKNIFSAIALATITFANAQKPIFTQAKIESARVYSNSAELKHKTIAQVPTGTSEIVITNVANYLNENTVQISVPKYVTVMSVQFSNAYLEEYDNAQNSPLLKPVRDSIKLVENELQKLKNTRSTDQKAIELLDKNQQISNSQNFTVLELSKMLDFYKTKRNELSNSVDALTRKELVLSEKLNGLKGRLQFNQSNVESVSNGKLIVNIMSNQPGNIPLEITYLTEQASWEPSYDLRVEKVNDPIQMLYKAQVIQNTGIDWKNIKLSLTSGFANANTTAPFLSPWFLNYRNYITQKSQNRPNASFVQTLQEQVPGLNISTGSGQPGSSNTSVIVRGKSVNNEAAEPLYIVDGIPVQASDFKSIKPEDIANINVLKDAGENSIYGNRGANGVIVVNTKSGMGISNVDDFTEINETELNLSFNIDIPYSILSNNKVHSVSLKEMKVPAIYSYIAIPKLDLNAYLVATINDYGNYNILPGEANIIFEDVYVGKTFINPNARKDQLQLSLGKDPNILISRTLVSDKSGTKMLSSRKIQDFVYEISVRNNKKQPIDLIIEDQIPISTNTDIEVVVNDKDGGKLNMETGKITWDLNIKSNETKKIRFGYQIKSAKEKTLSL